jgi:hypothetical protein
MDFTLNFLPAGGLASSVITTVWVGIMVVVFFNLRFGTTLSGLVVPGYLIPLFIVHPVSGWVILVESVITYFIARLVADRGLVRLGFGEMFGRDRFFILILISVLVRIISDGFILPSLSEQLALWGAPYELRSGLHSFGLIIIALCANQFWNGGIKVGATTLAVYLLVTYAIVAYVLMPLTNFNISTLGYMYEDIASSILASPKAYIILITAAYVSSRMNLRYGWDFNGILIPSLLALQWYDPFKILTTFVEAIIILLGAQMVMRMPVIRSMNMEGARQLLLFFNVGFFYKLALGFVIIYWTPEQKVTDYYGFGYVLGTLMALKMYQKGIAIRFTRTTLQTSLVAIVMASLLGFGLTFFATPIAATWAKAEHSDLLQTPDEILPTFVSKMRTLSYQSEGAARQYPLTALDASAFAILFKQTATLTKTSPQGHLNALANEAQTLGYTTSFVEQRYLGFHETDPHRGWGIFIIDTHSTSDLAIEVPRALDEPKAAAVAERVFNVLDARYLAFSGARANRSNDRSDDVLLNSLSLMQIFHQAVANNSALQLRGYTRLSARQLMGLRKDQQALDLDVQQTTLWVKRALPGDLNLQRLEALLGSFEIHWHSPPTQNRQRDATIKGFVEVYVNHQSLFSVYAQTRSKQAYKEVARQQRIDGYLQSFLQENKLQFAAKYSEAYQVADKYELLYFDQAVLQEALTLVDQVANNEWNAVYQDRLNQISQAASQFAYEVLLYRHIPTGARYIIFKHRDKAENDRYWGTYALKLGSASEYIIEVPMPVFEQNTFEFGTQLFETLNARAILISGTHPLANEDGSSQLTSSENVDSLFNLFHQSLMSQKGATPFAVQIRGFNPQASEDADKPVVAHFEYQKPGAQSHPGLVQLKKALQDSGLKLQQPDSEHIHERFQAKLNAQSRYSKYISNAQYAEVWLPTLLRNKFQRNSQDNLLSKKMAALDFEQLQTDVKHWLTEQSFVGVDDVRLNRLKGLFERFDQSQNINQLLHIRQSVDSVKVLLDHNSQQFFLALADENKRLLLVVNLSPLNVGKSGSDIEQFVSDREHYLVGEHSR